MAEAGAGGVGFDASFDVGLPDALDGGDGAGGGGECFCVATSFLVMTVVVRSDSIEGALMTSLTLLSIVVVYGSSVWIFDVLTAAGRKVFSTPFCLFMK